MEIKALFALMKRALQILENQMANQSLWIRNDGEKSNF